jgi:hypothetical protein
MDECLCSSTIDVVVEGLPSRSKRGYKEGWELARYRIYSTENNRKLLKYSFPNLVPPKRKSRLESTLKPS